MAGMVKRADFLENEVVDLTEEIKLVSPTDTPLTTLLMGRGQVVPANDITVTWREKELNSDRGTLKLEGSEAGEAITSGRKTLSNVCQIIEKVTQVSGTARSLNPKGIGDVFNSEVQDRLVETKRDMEWYFLNGTKALESGSTEIEQRAKSNTNRLNEHDEILKSNSEMIGAIKELATEVKYMRGDLNKTVERLNKLEGKDGDKWDKFKWLIVTGLVTLILGYLAVSVGLK